MDTALAIVDHIMISNLGLLGLTRELIFVVQATGIEIVLNV